MQLCASELAQLFTQHEYRSICIDEETLELASANSVVRIPFSIWNGKITVKRGLIWSELKVLSHEEKGRQTVWVVQGLPWPEAKRFAKQAVHCYQLWHTEQCRLLNTYLPQWEEDLHRLIQLPRYLPHSKLQTWCQLVDKQFTEMSMSLCEAKRRMPDRIEALIPWLDNPAEALEQRNYQWVSRERENWQVLFSQSESSPLNLSQQQAVLLNNDHNLVLAGAGSGKTSVLVTRVSYLIQSHLAQPEEILMLAFGRDAATEMRTRLESKFGQVAERIQVLTFHQLGLNVLRDVAKEPVTISPLATEERLKTVWCIDWLKRHWMTPTNFKRWQKHLSKWPIAYLKGDDELGSQTENPKLIAWLEKQLDQLISSSMSKKDIQEQIVSEPDYSRLNSELMLTWPCYQAWLKQLKEQRHVDFTTMIQQATKYIKNNRFRGGWKFIMVDEYQDISPDRLALVQSLCEQSNLEEIPTLFAVGDDWQSIYQFTGSNVDLTTSFDRRFPNAVIHNLDTTYRFNSQLALVANDFIQKNPNQLEKVLNSYKEVKQKSVIVEPMGNLEKRLDELNRKTTKPVSVLILGRNHYHCPELMPDWCKRFNQLQINFMTCHGSKGKEADFVFIVHVDEGQFPSKKKSIHLSDALTKTTDTFPYAEERRLFYVALTRARRKSWVMYSTSPSEFALEMIEHPRVVQKKEAS
jgi:DNA helicase-4